MANGPEHMNLNGFLADGVILLGKIGVDQESMNLLERTVEAGKKQQMKIILDRWIGENSGKLIYLTRKAEIIKLVHSLNS